ncbi:hypothetical protein DPMN_075380 [Dreissena polymorpha]|uniref:Sushi domain-containing protein n=1 Tax=Dreissena polymorpha TaxID=45954 RepID=A0A9D3YKD5_DREPO|nr:hypothetical protein DPMN_075380 [Dreissena polymorpha]
MNCFHYTVSDCGPLPAPSEGTVTSQKGTTYGQTARYTCNPGYQLLGATTRLCQENGLWTEETPVCRKYGKWCCS